MVSKSTIALAVRGMIVVTCDVIEGSLFVSERRGVVVRIDRLTILDPLRPAEANHGARRVALQRDGTGSREMLASIVLYDQFPSGNDDIASELVSRGRKFRVAAVAHKRIKDALE